MDKEEPSLADQFVATTHITKWGKHVQEAMLRYRLWMRHAHRFVLTDAFTEMATIMSLAPPEKILARLQYATLPYDTTWIEFNLHAKMTVIAAHYASVGRPGYFPRPEQVPTRLGMLLQRIDDTTAVCTLVDGGVDEEDSKHPLPHLTSYFFSTVEVENDHWPRRFGCVPIYAHGRLSKTAALSDHVDMLVKGSLWGFTDPELLVKDMALRVPDFLARHGNIGSSLLSLPMAEAIQRRDIKNGKDKVDQSMVNELREFTGTVRWLVTVLAMLNEVPISTDHVVPTGYQRAGLIGKTRRLDYHKVALVLPKTNPVRYLNKRLSHAEITRRRAHEVRAHWRTYLHETHCGYEEHDWVYDHDNGYRLCGKCEAYGRLIHEHVRGDAKLGWVNKTYVLKTVTRSA